MNKLKMVAEMNNSTVVSEYEPAKRKSESYQSEDALEKEFIRMLGEQGYEYLTINENKDLVSNLRVQLSKLNEYDFSDKEWERFFSSCIANQNEGIVDKTRKIQTDHIQAFKTDEGVTKNIKLIDKKNVHNNRLQVINQYKENSGEYDNRYDVTILVNGLPLVHVELKRRGVALKEAFNQINRYQRESFWAGSGLYEYIQIFIISNGTNTKYYSNTTRESHIKEVTETKGSKKKTSNSFEFTSFWADANNNVITDLVDFTKTFLAKHTILNILTKYCVFTTEELLLVMRPYQIVATERILNKIKIATSYKLLGTVDAGGYIWHTTGSGKTLTSFKTAQLATNVEDVDKVLFVVDRKDLDYQTMKEYDRFEKGCANGNKNTRILSSQLSDSKTKIIVTTIQKLSIFIKKNPNHDAFKKHIVIIFDECHRSQFGDMHKDIVKNFKKYNMFGFTGTPIFARNASSKPGNGDFCTTEQAFGDKLHTYTIVDAINDGNVLPFRIDYINTVKAKEKLKEEEVKAIDTEEILASPERVKNIVSYTLEHFSQKTKRNSYYELKGKRTNGFNSMFAVASIPMAKKYYLEFKKQIEEKNSDLTIATIYSFAPNEDENLDGIIEDESMELDNLEKSSREFLDFVIDEYNKKFKTNFKADGQGFQDYYKDLSDKVKKRQVDILIVVNMFLTGFDATTLNTLWVDKNLKQHGLIQAYSRTNRILNSVKTYGNIVCFRDLEKETNEAISLFGDKNANGIVLLKSYDDYYYGYDEKEKHHLGYEERIKMLLEEYPIEERMMTESQKRGFINQMSNILRLRNILTSFDRFKDNEILTERQFQDYLSVYNDIYMDVKTEKISIKEDVVFEMELVKQVEVNIDYILMLVVQYHNSNCENKEIRGDIERAIKSSLTLRSKEELINDFMDRLNAKKGNDVDVLKDWKEYVNNKKEEELNKLILEEKLNEINTKKFIEKSFKNGEVNTFGTDIVEILPKVGMFSKNKNRSEVKKKIAGKIITFFEKYFGII